MECRRVEQLTAVPGFAFFRFSPCRLSLVEQLAAVPGFISLCQLWTPSFSTLIERLTSFWHWNMTRFRLQDMPFRSLSFGWSGEAKLCTNSRADYFSCLWGWSEFSAIKPHQGILHWIVDASTCDWKVLDNLILSLPASSLWSIIATCAAYQFPWSPFSSSPPPCQMNTPCRTVRSQQGTLGWLWFSVGGFQVVFLHSASVFLAGFSPFHFAITSCISSISSNFLATACGSNFSTHNGHLPLIMFLGCHSSPRLGRATWMPLAELMFSARHLRVTVIFGGGLQVVFLHFVTSLVSVPSTSVFHASSAACRFAITQNHHSFPPTFQSLSADPTSPPT